MYMCVLDSRRHLIMFIVRVEGNSGQQNGTVTCRTITSNSVPVASNNSMVSVSTCMYVRYMYVRTVHVCDSDMIVWYFSLSLINTLGFSVN